MNPNVLAYLPLLSPIATLIVVVLGVLFSNHHVDTRVSDLHRYIDSRIQAATAEIKGELKQAMLELEMRLSKQISELDHRIERLEAQRLVR